MQVLGESVRNVIYHHVGQSASLRLEEIPEKLEEFHRALESIFGAGALVIEKLIASKLYTHLGLKFEEHENWTLTDYVKDAKKAKGRH